MVAPVAPNPYFIVAPSLYRHSHVSLSRHLAFLFYPVCSSHSSPSCLHRRRSSARPHHFIPPPLQRFLTARTTLCDDTFPDAVKSSVGANARRACTHVPGDAIAHAKPQVERAKGSTKAFVLTPQHAEETHILRQRHSMH